MTQLNAVLFSNTLLCVGVYNNRCRLLTNNSETTRRDVSSRIEKQILYHSLNTEITNYTIQKLRIVLSYKNKPLHPYDTLKM